MTRYHSTRDCSKIYQASECILQGLSSDGGLFVTDDIDAISFDISKFENLSYQKIAKVILSAFFDDFSDDQISDCVDRAYNNSHFETEEIFPVVTPNKQFSYLELYRGNTLAFKDAALSILPHLMKTAKENCGETRKIVILTATSGDTGKAALEGFKDIDGIDVIVFYPYQGVSKLQLLQMLTQEGQNVSSIALRGNFDDAQTNVKMIFNDIDFNRDLDQNNVVLSSANSINIGRLIPQIVYYYDSYRQLVTSGTIQQGDSINFVVPTGNFGNILAGYYAYKTGLPIHKLICASNENNVLYDFFRTGTYDKNRSFKKTISPSMDILISSNLERLIYEMTDRDPSVLVSLMKSLGASGKYVVDQTHKDFDLFYGGYATEDEIKTAIKNSYDEDGYLIDPHTATGYKVYHDYCLETSDTTHTVILSTASPFKFSKDVYQVLGSNQYEDDVDYMYALSEMTGIGIPNVINGIENRDAKDEVIIDPTDMKLHIKNIVLGSE